MHDVVIEAGAIERIQQHLPQAHSYVIISDANVAERFGHRVQTLIPGSHVVTFPAGEASKTREMWLRITDHMLDLRVARDACVIALGGGVTCDLAGFVAATYMRGVPVVQVPTSLLAMIDAAVGGKTGVDVPAGKNLVGAFHPPHTVVIDPMALNTLPDADLSNGLAEAIKHGAIADADYLQWITESAPSIFERRPDTLSSLIRRSVEIKAHFVEGDLREGGKRAALNFGHTIAHALEQVSSYRIPHGHAVALGMLVEAEVGTALGVTETHTTAAIHSALQRADLPHEIVFDDAAVVIDATRSDKKVRSGAVRYVLLEKAGSVARSDTGDWTWEVPDDVVREALRQFSV